MDLCKGMVRTRVKGNGSKAASSPATEPDFYSMEPCVEMPDDVQKQMKPSLPALMSTDPVPSVQRPTSGTSTTIPQQNYMAPLQPVFSSSVKMQPTEVLVSPPISPNLLPSTNSPELVEDGFVLQEENHSGDQVFFEGLPFHYVERKDVEEALMALADWGDLS